MIFIFQTGLSTVEHNGSLTALEISSLFDTQIQSEHNFLTFCIITGVDADNPSDGGDDVSGTESGKRGRGKKSPGGTKAAKLPACSLPTNMTPTFYVGGGNGVSL